MLTRPGRATVSGPWREDDGPAGRGGGPDRPDRPTPTVAGGRALILVCAHGVHDACCAIRGRPVAAALAEHFPGQVWECSHVGGDRFAPNVVLLPDGFYYGNLDPESAVRAVRQHLAGAWTRGGCGAWPSLPPPVQAAVVAAYDTPRARSPRVR